MQRTYPPAQLLQRPLPEGVDPTSLELYLSPQHFLVRFIFLLAAVHKISRKILPF